MLQSFVLGRATRNLSRYVKDQNILCFPGIEAWDFEFFKHQKYVKSITGLEDNTEIFNKVKKQYLKESNINLLNIKSSEFLATTDQNFDVIYLDYFSNLNNVVRFDVETILERKILNKYGKLIINLYGARESITDQYMNRKIYLDQCLAYNRRPREDTELDRTRAFNSLIMKCRKIYGVNFCCPSWAKYRSNNAYMYTAWLSCNGYRSSSTRGRDTGAVRAVPQFWFMEDRYAKIKEFKTNSMAGVGVSLARRGLKNSIRNHYKALLQKFYKEHGYTPSCLELTGKKGRVPGWTGLIREVGLCPRVYAKEEDLVDEMLRIEKRDGFVTSAALKNAKIFRKLGWAAEFRRLCEKHKIKFHLVLQKQNKKENLEKRIFNIKEYINDLDSKIHRTNSKKYSFARKHGVISYEKASKFLFATQRQLNEL